MSNDGPTAPEATLPTNTTTWGIYDSNGALVFAVDSFLGLEDNEKSKVSDFPVENGAFASYNKVQQPFQVKVRMAVGGDSTKMTTFINALFAAKESSDLYIIATPEFTFQDATVESFSYKRAAIQGADMIVADVELKEVRQVNPSFTNVDLPASNIKNKAAAGKEDNGKKQAAKPSDWKLTEGKTASEAVALAKERLQQLRGK